MECWARGEISAQCLPDVDNISGVVVSPPSSSPPWCPGQGPSGRADCGSGTNTHWSFTTFTGKYSYSAGRPPPGWTQSKQSNYQESDSVQALRIVTKRGATRQHFSHWQSSCHQHFISWFLLSRPFLGRIFTGDHRSSLEPDEECKYGNLLCVTRVSLTITCVCVERVWVTVYCVVVSVW